MAAQQDPPETTYEVLHDPPNDALRLLPIPPLASNLSNYFPWQHALWFHLRYHGLFYFLTGHEQSRWELRWHESAESGLHEQGARPTYWDRRNYMRRNMHAYAILFSSIQDVIPRLLEAGWDGDRDSFGYRTDLLWNRIQEMRADGQARSMRTVERAMAELPQMRIGRHVAEERAEQRVGTADDDGEDEDDEME